MVSVVDAQPGDTIIDCCAAPGGKALNLASRLNGQGMNSQLSSVLRIMNFHNSFKNEGDASCNCICKGVLLMVFVRAVQARS